MIDNLLNGLGSFLGNFGENAQLGSAIGGAFGPIGGLIGGGVGLLSDMLNGDDEYDKINQRKQNLRTISRDRSATQALRADWIANSNPVIAAENGADLQVQAMVAPGEVVVTKDGRVVHVKGHGDKDNVPWTGGPATVFGNLKMPGTNVKFKDFAKKHYRETKENTNVATGTLQAQAATARILTNMQKNEQQRQNIKPKTATVSAKNLRNIKNAKVPAAEQGLDYNTLLQQSLNTMKKAASETQQAIDRQNEASVRASLKNTTPVLTTTPIILGEKEKENKFNWKNMFANTLPAIGQTAMLYGNARENNMTPDQVPVNYNRLTPAAIRLGYSNTYDLLGGLNDVNNLNRAMTYNANAIGNSSGVNTMQRIAAHAKSLDAMRNVRHDYSVAQAEANRALGDFLHNAGAEDVVAENYQQDLQARNNAAAYKARQTTRRDIANAHAQIGKDLKGNANNDALMTLLQPYEETLKNALSKLIM